MSAQDNIQGSGGEPTAVIGSGFRFAGSAGNPSKLWELQLKSHDLLTKNPENQFNPLQSRRLLPSESVSSWNDRLQGVLLSWGGPPPVWCGFLQYQAGRSACDWPATTSAHGNSLRVTWGTWISIVSLAGSRTGVYVGLMCDGYVEQLNSDMNSLPTYTPTGNARSIMSNRISCFFDYHGPLWQFTRVSTVDL